jgi:SAM-dependent methyltransferase
MSWSDYWTAVAGRPPRPTLLAALDRFGAFTGLAVDLGCGEGRDTIELLRRGWRVVAIDSEAEAIRRLRARPDLPASAELETSALRFEDAAWPQADLVNASFSLPFCPPERFDDFWGRLRASLNAGGRFCGQLFGERDEWAGNPGLTIHTRADVERRLQGLEIEILDEEEADGKTAVGKAKHWHIFQIVVRRP